MPDHGTDDTDGLSNDSLSVLLAFGEPVTFTATVSQNSPPASPEPVTYTGGRFALEIDGHSSASPHLAPWLDELGWATDNNLADTGTDDDTGPCTAGSLAVLHALMQHEAHSSEASLLGQSGTEAGSRLFVGNLTMHSEASSSQKSDFPLPPPPPPPPKSLHGTEPDGAGISVHEFAVENFPAFPQPENNAVSGDGGTKSDGQDDGWCMATDIDFPESVHALYDLIV